MAKPDGQPHFDSSEMRMMHNMFRREFALMPGLEVLARRATTTAHRSSVITWKR